MIPLSNVKAIVQGITGRQGSFHTRLMLEYGTNIVGGVTPGKGGQTVAGKPVFNTVGEAVRETGATASVIFVPAQHFLDAALEAIEAGISFLVAITERVPVRDTIKVCREAKRSGATLIGPNTPGVIVPGVYKLGVMPTSAFSKGNVAVFSRSGTLMYEISQRLVSSGLGQRVVLGIGADPVTCTTFENLLEWCRDLDEVKAIVIIGEIGGVAEERLASYISRRGVEKPVAAFIAGRHAPKERRMGHAGAIVYGSYGSAESKISALLGAGVAVAKSPYELSRVLLEVLGEKG